MSVAVQPSTSVASLRRIAALTFIAASALAARPVGAQSVPRGRVGVGIVGGAAQYDMSGTGTTAFGALRADGELTRWLVLEGSLGVMRPHEQSAVDVTYLIPEVQLQVQSTMGHVRPYVGAGVALVAPIGSFAHRNYGVGSASLGARTQLTPSLDLRTELRVTGVSATLAQWTLGLSRRL